MTFSNLSFHLRSLLILLLLIGSHITYAQPSFTGTEVTLAPTVLQDLEDQGICDDLAFSIDVASLNNYVKNVQTDSFTLDLNIGTTLSFDMYLGKHDIRAPGAQVVINFEGGWESHPIAPTNFYRGSLSSNIQSESRLYISADGLDGYITKDALRYSIRPLSEVLENGPKGIWLICSAPIPPVPPRGDCDFPTIEIALEADQAFYEQMGGDVTAIAMMMDDVASRAADFYADELNLLLSIRNKGIRADQDDYCCADIPISNALNRYYNISRPCVEKDFIMLFAGKPLPGRGGQDGSTVCLSGNQNRVPTGWINVEADIEDMVVAFAHELGHGLGAGELEDCTCPDADKCDGFNDPLKGLISPLMCTSGVNTSLFLSQHSRSRMSNTLEMVCDLCLDDNRPIQTCERCENTITMETDNRFPLEGCGERELITVTIEVCPDCDAGPVDVTVIFSDNNQELVAADPAFIINGTCNPGSTLNTYMCLDGLVLNVDECQSFQFTTRLIDGSLPDGYSINATLTSATDDAIAIIDLDPADPEPVGTSGTTTITDLIQTGLLDPVSFACGTSTASSDLEIEGTLLIDQDYCFLRRSNLIMQAGASIVVPNGQTLTIEDSRIFSCTDMWQHITVQDGATLVLKDATIEDAEFAVLAESGAHLDIQTTTFRNNYVGLEIPTGDINLDGIFYGNIFEGVGELKTPRKGEKAHAGIRVNNGNALLFGTSAPEGAFRPNQYRNLENGIISTGSLIAVLSSEFIDITQNGSGTGRAITSVDDFLIVGGFRPEDPAVNFNNCGAGIFSQQSHLFVRNSNLSNLSRGIRVVQSQNRVISIENNTIDNANRGIDVFFNQPGSGSIEDNTINSNTGATGIRIHEFIPQGNGWRIENNTFQLNDAVAGIIHRGGGQASIENNTITASGNSGYDAIRMEAGANHKLSCNLISGEGMEGKGIFNQGSPGMELQCNEIGGTPIGINFWGMCDGTMMQGNALGDHGTGLLMGLLPLDGNAVIGRQSHNGNLWAGSYSSGYGAQHLGTPTIIQFSTVDVDAQENPVFNTTVDAMAQWFFDESLPDDSYYCDAAGQCSKGIGARYNPVNGLNDLDYLIAEGKVVTDNYQTALQWTAARHLYNRLDNYPSLVPMGTSIDSFNTAQQTTVLGQFQDMDNDIRGLYTPQGNLSYDLHNQSVALEEALYQLIDLEALLLHAHSQTDSLDYAAQRRAKIDFTDSLAQVHQQSLLQVENKITADLPGLQTDNSSISTTAIYESNTRTINTVYLQTLAAGIDEFTPTQVAALQTIANQCPLAGGDAVWLARSLYSLYDDKIAYDDATLCATGSPLGLTQNHHVATEAEQGVILSNAVEKQQQVKIQLRPNPTKDHLQIQFNLGSRGSAKFVLYDSFGKQILTELLPSNSGHKTFSVGHLPAGVYQSIVYLDSVPIHTEKIVIIK
ncbi:MAG: right-handed parallel beta-helix repeat-containing protein [Bacteroidota bacterium]